MLGSIVSAGGGALLGGLFSGLGSAFAGYQNGKDAEKATARQIAWERERAQNAHQWEVEDLKKAGLNPILSASGSGAVTGGISAPLPDRSGYAGAGTAVIEALNSAYNAAHTAALIGKTGAETNNITQDTQNKMTAQELMQKQVINEGLRSGLISAQKANQEFKNLTEKYNGERAALTYWNDFINKASNSAKNVGDLTSNVIDRFIPAKHVKEVRRVFQRNRGYTETTTTR